MAVAPDATQNPLLDGLRVESTPDPTTLVIFGASGDLTRRKLLPALYQLARAQRLPARFSVIGVSRSAISDDDFRQQLHDSLREFAGLAQPDDFSLALARSLTYVSGELNDPALYEQLCGRTSGDGAPDGVFFYFAIPPTVYGSVAERLAAAKLTTQRTQTGWRRVI